MVKPFTLISLAVVLVLIIALLQALRHAKNYYILYNHAKLFPLDEHPAHPQMNTENLRISILGDSRAAAWAMKDLPTRWTIDQLGMNGFTSEQLKIMLLTGNFNFTRSVVILQIGINDLKMIPLFPDKQDSIIRRLESNLSFVIHFCKDKGADKIIVSTIFPIGKIPFLRRAVWSNEVYTAVQRVNQHIKSLKSEDVTIFDSCEILEDKNHIPSRGQDRYYEDALHLNREGYKVLNQSLFPLINASGS